MRDKNSSQTILAAIYTRKSTEEGLQQEFNSLDAQRESGEAYIIDDCALNELFPRLAP